MKPKRKLTQIFSLMLSGVSLVSILLIGALWISFETNRSKEESLKVRQDYIAAHQATINLETNRICDYMEAQRQSSEIKFLKELRSQVYEAYSFISAIQASANLGFSPDQIQELTLNGLKGMTFNQGRGRYFISEASGQEIFSDDTASYESLDILTFHALSDYSSPSAFIEVVGSLNRIKEGFFRYNLIQGLRNPGDEDSSQVAYMKMFEPYQWILGTSAYPEDYTHEVQSELLDWAANMAMPDENYLMIVTYDGDILSYPEERMVGTNIFTEGGDNPAYQKIVAGIIRGAKDRNKDFTRYTAVTADGAQNERIAYYRAIPAWRWVVVTWVNFNDLEAVMAERQALLTQNVQSQILRIVIISISMLAVIMLLSKVLSSLATRSFSAFSSFFEHASTSSIEINPGEQPFEEFARLAVAANNMIKQRVQASNLLHESELKFKTIFDVSPQIITMSDLEGVLLNVNEEFRKFSSLELTQALGRPLEDSFVISHEARQELWQDLKRKGSILGREIKVERPDGSSITFLLFGRIINLKAGAFILAIFTDITALKEAENEKLALQEKLSRSTKMEAMGLMAAEVAHDLNNILSGIIGYPQLLLMEENITGKQKEVLNEILETGQRAAAVVSDLLTIARGVASTKTSLPVNTMVTDYTNSPECKQLQELFPHVRLNTDLSPNAGNIMASSVHLTKVIMNLVSNAFEAMPTDKANAEVTVKTESVDLHNRVVTYDDQLEPGQYVLISVSDNGPGIPADDLNKIFEPFYSKKMKGRSGTGLGLAIVWNTISDHSGHLDVQSGPTGTRFSIYIKNTEEKTAAPSARKNLDEYKGAGQRVLIVDDVDIQRKLAAKMLKTLGYEPIALPSGEAAIAFLKTEDVALVILDMIMHPGINGRETFEAIMQFKPGQKAIIASGMAETEEVSRAQALGAGQFVNKPYTIEDLAVAVKRALEE